MGYQPQLVACRGRASAVREWTRGQTLLMRTGTAVMDGHGNNRQANKHQVPGVVYEEWSVFVNL